MKKIFTIIFLITVFFSPAAHSIQNKTDYINLNWWNNFNDEYLTDNLMKLYSNNYDLKNAALKIKENEQLVKMQFANELPAIALTGQLSRDLRAARQQFGSMQISTYSQNHYNIPITAAYEIDIWGTNRLKTKSKKEQLEIIKQAERATYISLTSVFAADYFNLIKTDKMIQLQDELIKTQESILTKTIDKYNTGLCPISEVLAQEKFLTLLKEEHNAHLQAQEVLINTLKVYLSNTEETINRNSYEKLTLLNNIPSEYSTNIITNRPDYLQEEANLRRIGFDVKAAKREFLPTFTIFGQIGLNAYNLKSLFNGPSQFLNAGVLPSLDLFSGGRKMALLKMKKFQYEQAVNDYQKAFITGVKEVNNGLIEYKTAKNNFEETEKRIDLENKIFSLVNDKAKIGAASELDVLTAKEAQIMTQKEEVSNKIDSILATISLYKAVGGVNLYDIEKI